MPNSKGVLTEPPLNFDIWMSNYIPQKSMGVISNSFPNPN